MKVFLKRFPTTNSEFIILTAEENYTKIIRHRVKACSLYPMQVSQVMQNILTAKLLFDAPLPSTSLPEILFSRVLALNKTTLWLSSIITLKFINMHFPSPTSFSNCISIIFNFTQNYSFFFTTIYLNTFLMCHTWEASQCRPFRQYSKSISSLQNPLPPAMFTSSHTETFHKDTMFRKISALFQTLRSPLQSLHGALC